MKYGNLVERDHGPPAERAARFYTTPWTVVMRAALIQCNGGSPLWPDCGGSIGIHSASFARRRRYSPAEINEEIHAFCEALIGTGRP